MPTAVARSLSGNQYSIALYDTDPISPPPIPESNMNSIRLLKEEETNTSAKKAPEVILPMALPIETTGHLIDSDGELKQLASVLASPSGKENWEVLIDLAAALGLHWDYADAQAVTSELEAQATRRPSPQEFVCRPGTEGGLTGRIDAALAALGV